MPASVCYWCPTQGSIPKILVSWQLEAEASASAARCRAPSERVRLVCGMSNLVACDGAVYAFGSALYPMNLQSVSNPSLVSLSLIRFPNTSSPRHPADTVSFWIERETTLLQRS